MGYSLATQRGVHTGCTWRSIRNVNFPSPSQVYVNQNSGVDERGTPPGDSNTHWSRPFPGVLFYLTSFFMAPPYSMVMFSLLIQILEVSPSGRIAQQGRRW